MWITLWIVGGVLAQYGLATVVGRFLSLSNPRHVGYQGGRQQVTRPSRVIYSTPRTDPPTGPATSPGSW